MEDYFRATDGRQWDQVPSAQMNRCRLGSRKGLCATDDRRRKPACGVHVYPGNSRRNEAVSNAKRFRMTTEIPDEITTPPEVATRIGTLEFFDGIPTEATARTLFDHLDFLRGV